jgi:hypothetical protein
MSIASSNLRPWVLLSLLLLGLCVVRLSKTPHYTASFEPGPRLVRDAATRHLLEMDRVGSLFEGRLRSAANWQIRAFHYAGDTPSELPPDESEKGTIHTSAGLPLILTEPAVVESGGLRFHLADEGFYRIGNLNTKETRHAVLYRGDLWRFLGSLSRLQVHGWRHNHESNAELTERARKGRLSISCGKIVTFIAHHASAQGIRCRPVKAATAEQMNGYDDGHVLMEVFDPKERRWLLYDADAGCRFKANGRYLNLGEAVRLYRSGRQAELEFLRKPAIDTYAEAGSPAEFTQYSLLLESIFRDTASAQAWYARILQVPTVNGVQASSAHDWDKFLKDAYER